MNMEGVSEKERIKAQQRLIYTNSRSHIVPDESFKEFVLDQLSALPEHLAI